MKAAGGPSGLLVVDKEAGWTSHDVVAKLRGVLSTRKVGHAGTLDPDATGVLLVGAGQVTRLLRYLAATGKAYDAVIALGTETSTLDAAGEVTATHDMSGITGEQVLAMASTLVGDIEQIPPMVSAVKVAGRRLHELARAGIEVERQPVPVHVARYDVGEPVAPGVFPITVTCSSGTYVRSLVADLGTALGGGAHLRNLRRHAVGAFSVDEAVTLEQLGPDRVLPPLAAFRGTEPVVVEEAVERQVRHGAVLAREELGVDPVAPGPWPVVDPAGALLAVYVAHRPGSVKPGLVLVP